MYFACLRARVAHCRAARSSAESSILVGRGDTTLCLEVAEWVPSNKVLVSQQLICHVGRNLELVGTNFGY